MKILESIQNKFILMWFCSSENSLIKCRNIFVSSMSCFVGAICCALTSAAYIPDNLENDLEGCLSAIMVFLGSLSVFIMIISAYVLRHKISEVFSDYQHIYDNCK